MWTVFKLSILIVSHNENIMKLSSVTGQWWAQYTTCKMSLRWDQIQVRQPKTWSQIDVLTLHSLAINWHHWVIIIKLNELFSLITNYTWVLLIRSISIKTEAYSSQEGEAGEKTSQLRNAGMCLQFIFPWHVIKFQQQRLKLFQMLCNCVWKQDLHASWPQRATFVSFYSNVHVWQGIEEEKAFVGPNLHFCTRYLEILEMTETNEGFSIFTHKLFLAVWRRQIANIWTVLQSLFFWCFIRRSWP